MNVGTAQLDITPSRPLPICGQLRPRLGEHAHDPLTANAVVFEDLDATTPTTAAPRRRAAVVSCDVLALPDALVRAAQQRCQRQHDIDAHAVIVAATHTHLAPCTVDYIVGTPDPAYMRRLEDAIVAVVGQAIADLEPAVLYAASGQVPDIAYNRRGVRKDGTAEIYHGSWNSDFSHVEGPRDGQVPVIFARRRDGRIKAILAGLAVHPNCMEDEHFYSADLPGAVRAHVRQTLGREDVGIAYLTGAAGNTAPTQLDDNPKMELPWRGEAGWRRAGQRLGDEILRVIQQTRQPMEDPRLRLAQTTIDVPLRPWPAEFDPRALANPRERDFYGRAQAQWPRMMRQENPAAVRLSVLRLGDAAICFNPAEPYVELGLAIKQRSPARRLTMIAELADGYCGYIPRRDAFARGGYCTMPAPTSKLALDADRRLVSATVQLLTRCFGDGLATGAALVEGQGYAA